MSTYFPKPIKNFVNTTKETNRPENKFCKSIVAPRKK